MTKRQTKKKQKKIAKRIESLKKYIYAYGRRNGKTAMIRKMNHAIYSQKHKAFKELIKELNTENRKWIILVDHSKGKDRTVIVRGYKVNGVAVITKIEMVRR